MATAAATSSDTQAGSSGSRTTSAHDTIDVGECQRSKMLSLHFLQNGDTELCFMATVGVRTDISVADCTTKRHFDELSELRRGCV